VAESDVDVMINGVDAPRDATGPEAKQLKNL
jgi:hypothetical protein